MNSNDIYITVPIYNRKNISLICVEQLFKYKKDAFINITDDYTTKYDVNKLLGPYSNKVTKYDTKLGIEVLRCYEFREFLKTDYKYLYMTDNDAFHDPNYIDRLIELYTRYNKPVCLYNTKHHFKSTVASYNDIIIRKTMPGISQLYSRDMVIKIVKALDEHGDTKRSWDFIIPKYLGLNNITSNMSYIEHFGGPGSIHNKTLNSDIAVNPTEYLKEHKRIIIRKL